MIGQISARTSFEPASVMEFGFYAAASLLKCLLSRHCILADFAVEFVEKFDVDPRYLEPVLVAKCSTTVVCHLRPVNADFHVNFRPVSVHAVYKSFVERLRNDNSCEFSIANVTRERPRISLR